MKRMKKIAAAALALICCLSFAACDSTGGSSVTSTESNSSVSQESSGAQQSESSDTADSTDSTDSEESTDADSTDAAASGDESKTEEEIYDDMVSRSLMTTGDTARMAKVINKLENKEEVTVAFLGGSITEGLTAGADLCWAKLTYDYLCEKYPDTTINYVNAGMSGTPSILGNIRLHRDVLDKDPDLVFVEFAVNDGKEQLYKDSYEALVRELLSAENQPAVVLYFTVLKSGHTCEDTMSPVGEAYGLPMVSLNNVLKPEFDSGRMTWEDYSDDESHPNVWGHEMTKDLIVNMFEKVDEAVKAGGDTEIKPIPDEWVYDSRFEHMMLTDRVYNPELINITSPGSLTEADTLTQFPNGWMAKGSADDAAEPMEFTFTGDNLFMIYHCADSPNFSSVKVTVDGEETGLFPTSSPSGWNNPDQVLIFSGEKGEHKVTLTPVPAEGTNVILLRILGFGITN